MSNGKGDTPRPLSVDQKTFSSNWDKVFKTNCEYSGLPSVSSYDDAPEEYKQLLSSGMFWEKFPRLTGVWSADKSRWLTNE